MNESDEILRSSISILLAELEKRAKIDQAAGRLPAAETLEAGARAVSEYIRRLENSIQASRQSILALEKPHALDS